MMISGSGLLFLATLYVTHLFLASLIKDVSIILLNSALELN